MSKFRTTQSPARVENRAGGEAFEQSPKLQLVSLLLTSFVKDKFYESEEGQLQRLETLIKSIKDKQFVGKSAVYARQEFGMRSITHALIGELVKEVKGEKWLKSAVEKTIKRPDDMLEILAYYLKKNGKPVPNSLKKGLRIAINKFDAYQLAKYRGAKASVKMVDLVNLVHPKGKAEIQDALKKLVEGDLKSKDTWEVKQTQAGQAVKKIKDKEERKEKLAELKRKNWEGLIKEKKLGYFALLRNLRNLLYQAPDTIDEAIKQLTNKTAIKKSLVLPFRFASAIREIEKTSYDRSRDVVVALGDALEIALDNVPKFDGKTLIVLDESGSMDGRPIQIGSLFAAMLYKTNDADLMSFSEDARYRTLNPSDSALSIAKTLQDDSVMQGTDFHAPFRKADKKYDRIIILSDEQGWIGYDCPTKTFAKYKERVGGNPHIYSIDLQGYGDMQFPEKQVYCIAGFSDKIFDVMKLLEKDRQALISEIEKIEL